MAQERVPATLPPNSRLLTAFRKDDASPAAESGNLDVTNRADPAPTPAGQEAGNATKIVAPNMPGFNVGDVLYQSVKIPDRRRRAAHRTGKNRDLNPVKL